MKKMKRLDMKCRIGGVTSRILSNHFLDPEHQCHTMTMLKNKGS
jgi:hypothetical protein